MIRTVKRIGQELRKEIEYQFLPRPRKILFDHLPKCGGNSLTAYLNLHYPKRKVFSSTSTPRPFVEKFKVFSQPKRYGYDLVAGHLVNELIGFVHPECLKITMFREPIDRIVSHYYYAKSNPKHYLHSRIVESKMSLEDFVISGLGGETRNWYTAHFSGLSVGEAERKQEESVANAVNFVMSTYDVIGFLDNFSSFVKSIRDKAKLRYEYQDIKKNVTENRLSIRDVSQSTINKIEEVNNLDIIFYKKIKEALGE